MAFNDRNEYGRIGENLFIKYFYAYAVKMGWEVEIEPYGDMNSSHRIDFIVTIDGVRYLIDVKTKRCRELYADTGIDYPDYLGYNDLSMEEDLDVKIAFVDYHLSTVYWGNLNDLDVYDGKYPKFDYRCGASKGIVYFRTDSFETIGYLTREEIELLKSKENSRW